MRIQFSLIYRFKVLTALAMIFFCGMVIAEEKVEDYILEVSVTGINGNYDEFIQKYCKLSDDVIIVPEYFAKDCTEGGFFAPAAGTEVVLKNSSGEIIQTQNTDSKGKCSFRGLPRAPYYAEVITMRPSSLTGTMERIVYRESNFNAQCGEFLDDITIEGRYFFTEICGRVVDASGKGVKGIPVNLVANTMRAPSFDWKPIEWNATTDVAGKYAIPVSVREVDLFMLGHFCVLRLRSRITNSFEKMYHVEVGDGKTQIGIGKPFFILTEEMHHYIFSMIKNLPESSIWFKVVGGKKNAFNEKRKYPGVPKSKGHVLFLPDIVLEKVQETTAE